MTTGPKSVKGSGQGFLGHEEYHGDVRGEVGRRDFAIVSPKSTGEAELVAKMEEVQMTRAIEQGRKSTAKWVKAENPKKEEVEVEEGAGLRQSEIHETITIGVEKSSFS